MRQTPIRSGASGASGTSDPGAASVVVVLAVVVLTLGLVDRDADDASTTSGSGPSRTSATTAASSAANSHSDAVSDRVSASRPAARNGPMNRPSRCVPPSSERARARNSNGTRVAMRASRATPKAEALNPTSRAAASRVRIAGAQAMSRTPTNETPAAIAIDQRSPIRATRAPAGMLPSSSPDHEHRPDQGCRRDVGAEPRGQHGQQRQDCSFAEREQESRSVDDRSESSDDARRAEPAALSHHSTVGPLRSGTSP